MKPREFWVTKQKYNLGFYDKSTGDPVAHGCLEVHPDKCGEQESDYIQVLEARPIDWDKVWKKYFEESPEGFLNEKRVGLIQQLVEKQLAGEQ